MPNSWFCHSARIIERDLFERNEPRNALQFSTVLSFGRFLWTTCKVIVRLDILSWPDLRKIFRDLAGARPNSRQRKISRRQAHRKMNKQEQFRRMERWTDDHSVISIVSVFTMNFCYSLVFCSFGRDVWKGIKNYVLYPKTWHTPFTKTRDPKWTNSQKARQPVTNQDLTDSSRFIQPAHI